MAVAEADVARAQLPVRAESDVARRRLRLSIRGLVQGVGFRPHVYVLATDLLLSGIVANTPDGVEIEVEGPAAAVDEFARRVVRDAPPLAVVAGVTKQELPPTAGTGFRIEASHADSGAARGRTFASPDVASCPDCLREMTDPTDRRHRHPFISCTNCGPRLTIITGLPYDRPLTTMAEFAMCSACEREYRDAGDRRFHAQTIACHDCGPTLELVLPGCPPASGEPALLAARRLLVAGSILAVKGLGGYHLACDASNDTAVGELRRRKRRGDKPFAVMVRDLATAAGLAVVDKAEEALLTGPQRPIVLLQRRRSRPVRDSLIDADSLIAESVAPGCPDVGLFLPYTPLHLLLFGLEDDEPGPSALVMTSGNLGGEPIVTDDADALTRLAPLVDGWLRHDRPIHVACDDSVVRVVDGEELAVRRSRGYAPMPTALPVDVPPTLAVGADLKNTFCLAEGRYAWLSQHVGDMDDLATLTMFGRAEAQLEELTGVRPERLAADVHPRYRSTGWARTHAAGRPVTAVQHHHAHVAAVMGEHGHDGHEPVLGVAFDGTGYGTDGAVWGGEVLVADYAGFRRYAHLGYVPLPGGDASVERPYRMACAHLAAAGVEWTPDLPPVSACPDAELGVLRRQLDTGFGCVPTSSIGRLFDAVSALAGVRQVVAYEAQAAIELEGAARSTLDPQAQGADEMAYADDTYRLPLSRDRHDEPWIADAGRLVRSVAADVRDGVPAALVGVRFHLALVDLIREVAGRAREELGPLTVVLGGGVFQNALLLRGAVRALRADGHTVLRPRRLPPNDGGLALGQLLVAASSREPTT
jgi:hydrogenase maturation protein HypF